MVHFLSGKALGETARRFSRALVPAPAPSLSALCPCRLRPVPLPPAPGRLIPAGS